MAVHVGEIHTELSASGSHEPAAATPSGSEPPHPGAREDQWRAVQATVLRLRHRVCAEDFDD